MSDEETPALIAKRINKIAEEICSRSLLGLVHNRPELWAQPAGCFANVIRKVAQDGGRSRFGWTFHHRFVERTPGPGYLFITHHAVWNAPDGSLVNVTPYPELRHHPYSVGRNNMVFLVDDNARPFQRQNFLTPLPLRFFSVTEGDTDLDAYVEELNKKEQDQWHKLIASLN
jgi:hypothetical protein